MRLGAEVSYLRSILPFLFPLAYCVGRMLRLVSLLGIFCILALLYLLSNNRRRISWRLVFSGLVIQSVLGLLFLYWQAGNLWLQSLGEGVKEFLDLSKHGTDFVFGSLANPPQSMGNILATQVLPTLIFFSALMAVLYHLGIMQFVVRMMAWLMARLLGTSGSESLSACGNIFVGQTEAPMLVRPYLGQMTLSEIHAVMTGGFCTIAGGVFVLYVQFGMEPGYLMVASVMAVPAGLICSKMLWPETIVSETMGKVLRTPASESGNVVEAAADGALAGLRLALNVAAMLIAFLGLVAVVNWLLAPYLELGQILGWLFYPLALVMGVEMQDVPLLAELLGKKIVLTELVAYQDLGAMVKAGQVGPRTELIATFALCGFANLASLAIQIGGLGAMAPERKSEFARLGMRAMFAGALATCMTAAMAGIMGGTNA